MDSINGIPLIWDSEGDKNLFGKLFNQGSLVPNLPNGNKFPQFPLNNDFTTLSPKDIGNKYYGNNPIYESKGVSVFAEDEIPPNTILLKEIKVYDNDFYKEFKDFTFTLFVSKNGARLLTQYKECVVSSNEIALFLEIDDVNNFTGSVMEAKVGSKVNQSKLPIAQMLVFMRNNRVNLEDSDVLKLLNGAFSSRNSLLHWLYSAVIRGATGITTFVFDSLDALNQAIISIFEALVIDEKHWNTEVKDYSNFFIPAQLLELLKTNNNDHKIAEAILLPITLQIDGIEKGIAGSLKLVKPILPKAIYNNLDQNLKLKFKEIDVFLEYIKQDSFLEFVKTATEVANAYLCGFLNSIVEFFKGIFEIIGIVLKMVKAKVDFNSEPLYYTSLLAEIFENIIGIIINFDLKEFIINAFTYPLVLLSKAIAFVKNTNFNLEGIKINLSKIGYIGGYIIGLVVAIIIDVLLTGGVKAAQDIIKALQTFLTKPGTVLKDLLQTAGRATVAVVETIIDLIATLANKLKNGAVKLFEDFKGFIDDVFKWLEEAFGRKKISQSDLLETWDSVAGRGRRLGQKLFKNDLIAIENFLKKLDCELELYPAKGSFEIEGFFVGNREKAIFHEKAQAVFITDGKKTKLILREKATTYEFFHEYMHLKQAKSIGLQKYYKLGGRNTAGEIVKEEYVFNKVIENKDLFTRDELKDALDYLNGQTYRKNGIDPINFNFDIEKIPIVRKEINIKTILNKKL